MRQTVKTYGMGKEIISFPEVHLKVLCVRRWRRLQSIYLRMEQNVKLLSKMLSEKEEPMTIAEK